MCHLPTSFSRCNVGQEEKIMLESLATKNHLTGQMVFRREALEHNLFFLAHIASTERRREMTHLDEYAH